MAEQIKVKSIQIAAAGTPTQIDSSYQFTRMLTIRNPNANTGLVYFGNSDLAANLRSTIEKGGDFTLLGVDPSKIYVDVATNNDRVEVVFYI